MSTAVFERTMKWVVIGMAVPLVACLERNPVANEIVTYEVIEELEFDHTLGVDLSLMTRLRSGVYIRDLIDGDPDTIASWGRLVDITFTGWIADGTEVIPTEDHQFLIGDGAVLQGFELGMIGQGLGGTRQMVVPPELAFGRRPVEGIPTGSALIFEVELTNVQ